MSSKSLLEGNYQGQNLSHVSDYHLKILIIYIMKCTNCESRCIKKGFQKKGVQKYYCKGCQRYQQKAYTYKAYKPFLKEDIVKMVKRSCGIRDIAFVKGISTTTVMKKVRSIADELSPPVNFPLDGDYEMDEMHTKVWKENIGTEIYIAYAIHLQSKIVVNFTVGGRDSCTLGKTVDCILLNYPKTIRTDKWSAYPCVIPADIHISSRRKINHIERFNLTLRTHLKRLGYNRLCHSKKVDMLEACLKIYFWG